MAEVVAKARFDEKTMKALTDFTEMLKQMSENFKLADELLEENRKLCQQIADLLEKFFQIPPEGFN